MKHSRVTRQAAWLVVFVLAGLLGRATIVDGGALSLVWPAAGVAALWAMAVRGADRRVAYALLAAATLAVNRVTGAGWDLAVVFVVTNLLQLALFLRLGQRLLGGPDGVLAFGGPRPLARLGDLGRLTAAAVGATLVGALVGQAGLALTVGPPDVWTFLVWWGRNGVGLLVVVTAAVLVRQARGGGRAAYAPCARGCVELVALLGVTAGLGTLVFTHADGARVSFLLLGPMVWAGVRFRPLVVVAQAVLSGTTAITFTVAGHGPFHAMASPQMEALVAQVFAAMTILVGLSLAFVRSERDEAMAALAERTRHELEQAQLLTAAVEQMHDGLVVLEDGGRIVLRNQTVRDLLGMGPPTSERVQPSEAYGLTTLDGQLLDEAAMPYQPTLRDGVVVGPLDFLAVHTGLRLEITSHPLPRTTPDEPRRAMIHLRDVTTARQQRDQLAAFSRTVAHDLRNPLTLVRGWSEMLRDDLASGSGGPDAVGLLPVVDQVLAGAEHMRRTIEDLLTFAVAEDHQLQFADVDVTALAEDLADLRRPGPAAPRIEVATDLRAWADEALLRQVLDNLLGNAVKYADPARAPRISVTGERSAEGAVLRVTDNGVGIAPGDRDGVFEPFARTDTARAGAVVGTGLGLSICRRIVERHHGRIDARANPDGPGTEVVVVLPAGSAA